MISWKVGLGLACLLVCVPTVGASEPSVLGRVMDFGLSDDRGREHSVAEWRGHRAVVLLFLGLECPVSNGYAPEFRRIAETYTPQGVAFYGIHVDPDVTAEVAREHAEEYQLPFPILLDPAQLVARQSRARVTPEAVVLASDGRILYRGRVDDLYTTQGRRRSEPTTRDLREALDATLAGRPPALATTEAFGCRLPRLLSPTAKSKN